VLFGPAMHGGELFPLNGPQWSLFWELIANAAHALVVRRLTTPVLVAIVTLSAAAVAWASLTFGSLDAGWGRANFWGGPPRVAFGFFAGLLLFRLHAAGWKAPRAPYPLIALALGACMIRWFPHLGGFAIRDIVKVIVVLPALVALAVRSPVSPRLRPAAVWLGAFSYPLYAIHVPLLRGGDYVINQLFDTPTAWTWWLCLAVTLILAAGFERFYDAPIRAWLRDRRRLAG
jgi:peptidoglycan/LPS O-acetylase OafA/YrhL